MPPAEGHIFRTLAHDFLAEGTPFVFVARGRSMAPFISDGDSVLIEPCGSAVRRGDVVLLKGSDGNLLLHRIIIKTPDRVLTRGDACLADDGFSRHEDIMGKAVKVQSRNTSSMLFFPFSHLLVLALRLRAYPRVFRPLRAVFKKVFTGNSQGKGC